MKLLVAVSLGFAWWYAGFRSFVWWWTKEFDLTTGDLGMAFGAGIFGPIAWLVGWSIHSNGGPSRVIRSRREP